MAAALKSVVTLGVSGAERLRIWLLAQRWFSGVLLPSLPRQLRWTLRKMYLAPLDAAERMVGVEGASPARSTNFTGAVSDFKESGDTLRARLVDQAGLTPASSVLDIGCGFGRLGAALIDYLDESGRYEGVDIVADSVRWCQQNVSSPRGNVRFTLADIYNREYNPDGRMKAEEFSFPFEDGSFDLIVLISVFTHMLSDDTDRYLREISRMLRPNGVCFATFYLLTPEALARMEAGESTYDFRYRFGDSFAVSKAVPELTVGYEAEYMEARYAACGLTPELHTGAWYCGGGANGQDLLIGRKTPHANS